LFPRLCPDSDSCLFDPIPPRPCTVSLFFPVALPGFFIVVNPSSPPPGPTVLSFLARFFFCAGRFLAVVWRRSDHRLFVGGCREDDRAISGVPPRRTHRVVCPFFPPPARPDGAVGPPRPPVPARSVAHCPAGVGFFYWSLASALGFRKFHRSFIAIWPRVGG